MRTENWVRYKKGDSENLSDYCSRIRAELSQLELAARIQWTGRRVWGSHTYAGGCWICDSFGVPHALLRVLEEYGNVEIEPSLHPVSEAKES